jgi:hypothetical protein
MVQTLWDSITEFLSPEAGQRRRAALDEFGRDIGYYVPPEMRGILGMVAEATPTASIDRASQSAVRMVQPGRTMGQRVGDLGGLLSETAGVVAPAMVAPRAGMTAAQAAQEMFMMPAAGVDDAARQFMVDDSGALRLWHGSPHDFPPAVRVLDKNTGKTYVQPANDPVTTGLLNLEPNRYSVLEENPLGMFDFSKMGTGEGAQAYGWGGYLAEAKPVAVEYRNMLSGNPYGDKLEVVMGGTPVKDPTDVQWAMAEATNKGLYVDTLKRRLAEAEAKVSASPKLTPGDDISDDDLQTLINISKRNSLKEKLAEAESLLDVDIRTKPPGHLYEARLKARPEQFLDWDIPLGQQSPYVKDALSRLGVKPFDLPSFNREAALRVSNLAEVAGLADWAKRDLMKAAMEIDASPDINYTLNRLKQMQMEFGISPDSGPWKETADGFLDFVRSSDVYKNADMPAAIVQRLADEARATGAIGEDIADAYPAIMTSQKAASQKLLQAGIPGSRHFDAGSRGAGSGTRNYVVFDENLIEIVRKYGIAGAAALLGISAADVEQAMAQGQPQGLLAGGPQ